jgi:hypothetical protein
MVPWENARINTHLATVRGAFLKLYLEVCESASIIQKRLSLSEPKSMSAEPDLKLKAMSGDAEQHSEAYRTSLLALALLGYAYIIGLVVFGVVLLIFLIFVVQNHQGYVLLLVLPIMLIIGESLLVKFDIPEGIRIEASEAPDLFCAIEDARNAASGPPIDACRNRRFDGWRQA